MEPVKPSDIVIRNGGVDKEQFLRLLEKMLELKPHSLDGTERLTSIKEWDSLAVIECLALVDEHLGIRLEYENIVRCTTLSELLALTLG